MKCIFHRQPELCCFLLSFLIWGIRRNDFNIYLFIGFVYFKINKKGAKSL